jgi:mRNA interferase MazF
VLEQGSIILIPIPFTDLSSQKRRPVVVVSNTDYHRNSSDMVVVAMTSNPSHSVYSFTIDSPDLDRGRLNRPGTVRVDRIYTLSQALIVREFGRVNARTLERIREFLLELVAEHK